MVVLEFLQKDCQRGRVHLAYHARSDFFCLSQVSWSTNREDLVDVSGCSSPILSLGLPNRQELAPAFVALREVTLIQELT